MGLKGPTILICICLSPDHTFLDPKELCGNSDDTPSSFVKRAIVHMLELSFIPGTGEVMYVNCLAWNA
jgi:hypothetical protein